MKGINLMKTIKNFVPRTAGSMCLCVSLFLALSCQQPFKAGLGPVVDTRPPTVTLHNPGVGNYIRSLTTFTGNAEDDYRLDSVWFKVTNYNEHENPYYDWQRINPVSKDGNWSFTIDTTSFSDGDLTIRLKAIDSVNKPVETDDLAFYVKNDPPEISLGQPVINIGTAEGELGGNHLNYARDDALNVLPSPLSYPRKLDAEGIIVGMIRDNEGVNFDTTAGFPPQYRMWRVDDQGADLHESWPPEELPEDNLPWKDFVLDSNLLEVGVNSYTFTIDLLEENILSERFYALQLRVQSSDKNVFYYPQNYWSKDGWDALPEQSKIENSYVLIYLRSPQEPPTLELYQFQNILGEDAYDSDSKTYNDIPGVDKNGKHLYVDRQTVIKNGPFTLRMKATHIDGIGKAVVFWDRKIDDNNIQRGRFIWDPASEDPYVGWRSGKVNADREYSEWGYNDPQSSNGIGYAVRSFVFTFADDPEKDKTPEKDSAGNLYHAAVRNKSKIQRFKGSDADWADRLPARWPFVPELDDSYWEGLSTLEDGTYNLEIWTASVPGTKIPVAFTCSITIDRVPPEVKLNSVMGSVSGEPSYTVNGVVRPSILIKDLHTGPRPATDSYFTGYDQFYILVKQSDAGTLNEYITSVPWPVVNNSLELPDNSIVKRHGPIFDGFLLKTSPIYLPAHDPAEDDTLPDDDYSLFVFARDNAFNVGREVFPLYVRKETDKPKIVFTGIDPNVDNPNVADDWPSSNAGKGFVVWEDGRKVRNKFNANSKITMELSDDDSLDLGTTTEPSGITVQITGSQLDPQGNIVPRNDAILTLSDAAIKGAFGTQPVDNGKRLAEKNKKGDITQQMLLNALKASSAYDSLFGIAPGETDEAIKADKKAQYNSLPSGIYRINITVRDYNERDIKLVMDPADDKAEVAETTEEFWIVVDSVLPNAAITSPASGGYISPELNVLLGGDVSDLNGPITVKSFTVSPDITNGAEPVTLCSIETINESIQINRDPLVTDQYNSTFVATVNLNNNSGKFTFTLVFIDRFGNERSASAIYNVDGIPPIVGLTKEIGVFSRDEEDVEPIGPTQSAAPDHVQWSKEHLVNGVVDFRITAIDYESKVETVRWWLLPVDKSAEVGATDFTSAAGPSWGQVAGFDAYPNTNTPNSTWWYGTDNSGQDGAYGEIADYSSDKNRVIIDTAKLQQPDGEYRLHIIAKDIAGNTSNTGINGKTIVQEIFLLQEEDKPYFINITPRDDVVIDMPGGIITIQGTINDDDGFAALGANSVKLWWWNSANDTTDPMAAIGDIITTPASYGYQSPITVESAHLTQQGNNLTLRIPLQYGPYGLVIGDDGKKYFILGATDDHTKKIKEDGDPEDDPIKAASRYKRYSFILDTKPPEIEITSPAPDQVFGLSAGSVFNLQGTLKDDNLKKDINGHYYFSYWLSSWTTPRDFPLEGTKAGQSYSYITDITGNVVTFDIPADIVTTEMFEFGGIGTGLKEGPEVLSVSILDLSEKDGNDTLSFTKDVSPPTFSFNGIGKLLLPQAGDDDDFDTTIDNWWVRPVAIDEQDWLKNKRDWLYAQTPTGINNLIIFNDTGALALSGMFEDTVSNIDIRLGESTTFKYWIDNAASYKTDVTWIGQDMVVDWSIPLTGVADGAHTIRFEISDMSGNTYESAHYVFILDSAAPRNVIDPPAHNVFGLNLEAIQTTFGAGTIFTISGNATDANLKDLGFKIMKTGTNEKMYPFGATEYVIIDGTWTFGEDDPAHNDAPIAEKFDWTFAFTTAFYTELKDNGKQLVDGQSYDIVTLATDRYGNKSEQAVWSFIVTAASPSITFSGGLKTSSDDSLTPSSFDPLDSAKIANRNRLAGASPVINGEVTDNFSSIKALQYRLEKWDYGTGAWTVRRPWADLSNLLTNTNRQVNWTYTLNEDQGFYRLTVQAKNAAYNELTDETVNGTYIPGRPGNPVVSDYVYFFYDGAVPNVTFDPEVAEYYSARLLNGTLQFTGSAKDLNRFRRVTVSVTVDKAISGSASIEYTWRPDDFDSGDEEQNWTLNLPVPYQEDYLDTDDPPDNQDYVLDGRYRLEFTATDMAGYDAIIITPFTLDSARPSGSVEEPAPQTTPPTGYPNASVIMLGGVSGYAISGRSTDTSPNRTESGVKEAWYHLGFVDNDPAWPTPQKLWAAAGVSEIDSGTNANNALFDAQVANNNTAWFKLGGAVQPTGFNFTSSSVNDWRAAVTNGLQAYALAAGVTLKSGGGTYIPVEDTALTAAGTGGKKLTQRLPLAATGQQDFIYRLPLWVRVVDTAGNVGYYCHDIWINRDGDIPQTTIVNPQNDPSVTGGARSPRGGPIRADGTATNNESVYAVIYRVYADGNNNPAAAVNTADLVTTFTGAKPISGNRDWASMQTILTTEGITTNGWYLVTNNDVPWSQNNKIPWNFTFNNNREITNLIATRGFNAASVDGTGTKDTIRVRLEVIVFKGNSSPERISVGAGTVAAPQPYVRTFFVNESAPYIDGEEVSTANDPDALATYNNRVVRRGKFAVKATLHASTLGDAARTITEISIRRPDELPGSTSYVTAWENGDYTQTITTNRKDVPGLTVTPIAGTNDYELTYILDSSKTAVPSDDSYGIVRNGLWRLSGGSYEIEVRIKDNATPSGEDFRVFAIGIDNFAPVADTHSNHLTPGKRAGSNEVFKGRALDYRGIPNNQTTPMEPDDRKVQKVMVWFTKMIGGVNYFINPTVNYHTNQSDARKTVESFNDPQSAYVGRNYKAGIWNDPTDPQGTPEEARQVTQVNDGNIEDDVAYPATTTGGWVMEISEGTALPGSGISWTPDNDWDIEWDFQQDTRLLPDGRITMNYLIYDEAGNASYYTQSTVIMNRYPVIDRVTLFTDNTGVGAVYTTDFDAPVNSDNIGYSAFTVNLADNKYGEQNGYVNSGFISKNQFIGFQVRTLSGNAPLNYRLHYVTRKSVALTEDNLKAMVEIKKKALDPNYTVSSTVMSASDLDGTELNLFTINEFGNYGSTVVNGNSSWYTIGVNADVIRRGTHFVFTPDSLTNDIDVSADTSVWAYTPVITNTAITGVSDNSAVGWSSDSANSIKFSFDGEDNGEERENFGTGTNQIGEFLDDSNPAFFLIKVWDSVNENGLEYDQLYDAVVVGTKVYLSDSTDPKVRLYDLNPYAETAVSGYNVSDTNRATTIANAADPKGIGQNILRGGLFNINTLDEPVMSGHIEPRNNTTALTPPFYNWGAEASNLGSNDSFTDKNATGFQSGDSNANTSFTYDQVSGRVILRGIAWDDQLIRNIRIKIGDDTDLTILQLNGVAMEVPTALQGSVFHQEKLHWKNGHIVEWAYVWDTAVKPASAGGGPVTATGGGVTIQVSTTDALAARSSASVDMDAENDAGNVNSPVSQKSFHNAVNVDIVPYIVGFERKKPDFVTKRSLQGWYSFYQGETGIAALGYNLISTIDGTGTRMRIFTGNTITNNHVLTTTTHTAAQNLAAQTEKTDYTRFLNHVQFDVWDATTAISGQIVLRVNGNDGNTNANITQGTAALNHQTSHTDHSWNREYSPYTNGSQLWINKPYAHIWRSQDSTTAPRTNFVNSAGLQSPGMALEYTGTNAGRLHGAWAVYDTAGYYYADNTATARNTLRSGSDDPYSDTDIAYWNGNGGTNNAANVVASYQYDGAPYIELKTRMGNTTEGSTISSGQNNVTTTRWKNNRIAKSAPNFADANGNAGRVFVISYDSFNRNLLFLDRAVANTPTRSIIDGSSPPAGNDNGTAISVASGNGNITTASSDAGEFSAIDYDSSNYPVIAYYDRRNDTLRYAYRTVSRSLGNSVTSTFSSSNTGNTSDDFATNTRYFQTSGNNNPNLTVGTLVYISGAYRYVVWTGTATVTGQTRYRVKFSTSETDFTVWPANNATTVSTPAYQVVTVTYTWNRRYVLSENDKGIGKYVSMKIDASDNIHLAFFNSELGKLMYAKGTVGGTFTAYPVDNVIEGGTWTDISVDASGNPWIVYGDTSRTGNRDGARIAYRDATLFSTGSLYHPTTGAAISDSTGWEALTMPSNYTVNDDRLNIEAWPPVNRSGGGLGTRPTTDIWNAAVGYASDMFRIAYFTKPGWKNY